MIYNHLISTHGAQCTTCAWSPTPNKDVFKLPPNVVVVMNCYNTVINSSDVIDAKVWQLATDKDLMMKLKNIVNGESTTEQIMNTVTEYITALKTLLNGNSQNRYCMYFDECPNMNISKETRLFRSGLYTLPVTIQATQKNITTQQIQRQQLITNDFSNYPSNDSRTRSMVDTFLIPGSMTLNPHQQTNFKIKSYGVREHEHDLSFNHLENDTLRAIIDDINENSGGNGFHVILFIACACGKIDPTPYRTEMTPDPNNRSISKFILKFLGYLVNYVNHTFSENKLCTIVPETLAQKNISVIDPQGSFEITKALEDGYCKTPALQTANNAKVFNVKIEPTCLYLSSSTILPNGKVMFKREDIKDWVLQVRQTLPQGWILDVYDMIKPGNFLEQNYVSVELIEGNNVVDEIKFNFDSSSNFTIEQTAFTSPNNNLNILFKLNNGNYTIVYQPSCLETHPPNTYYNTPNNATLPVQSINTYHNTQNNLTLPAETHTHIHSLPIRDNDLFAFFKPQDIDNFIKLVEDSKCIDVEKGKSAIYVGDGISEYCAFIKPNGENSNYAVNKSELQDAVDKSERQELEPLIKKNKKLSVIKSPGEPLTYTITFDCVHQQGGFVLEKGKVFLVNASKKHLVQLDKQQQAIIKVKGKDVLLKDLIVAQKEPKKTSTKSQKTNKTKSYKSSSHK